MSARLNFTKMHGLGNDFMVIDLLTQEFDLDNAPIARWADRHTGVGFDQLLAVAPPTTPEADFEYIVYNADGSRAEQCGNGARCVARFVERHCLSTRTHLVFETSTGTVETRLLDNGQVEVAMEVPAMAANDVPINANEPGPNYELFASGQTFDVTALSMGNPHAVIFVDDIAAAPVDSVGPALSTHDAFPEGANVGFCQIVDRAFVRLRVFERGVGETRACGSGACAAAVAGRLRGLLEQRVKVSLPGGKLRIDWNGERSPVKMTGPTERVYEGYIDV